MGSDVNAPFTTVFLMVQLPTGMELSDFDFAQAELTMNNATGGYTLVGDFKLITTRRRLSNQV